MSDEFVNVCQENNIEKLKALVKCKPNITMEIDSNGNTALHKCVEMNISFDILRFVYGDNKNALNQLNNRKFSPLILAIMYDNQAAIQFLLQNGADVNVVDCDGHSAVHWATVYGLPTVLKLLIEEYHADTSTKDLAKCCSLHYVTQVNGENGRRCLEVLLANGAFIETRDADERSPLHWSASSGNVYALATLIAAGANVGCIDCEKLTILHCAASRGQTEALRYIITLPFFLKNVDLEDTNGCTALFYALSLGFLNCAEILMNHKAAPNHQDKKLRTCGHYAAARDQLKSLKLLRNYDASFDITNHRGDLPLHEAVQAPSYRCVEYLLALNPEYADVCNSAGRSPLHIAAGTGDSQLCALLAKNCKNLNAVMVGKRRKMYTPLDVAEAKKDMIVAKYLKSINAKRFSELSNTEIKNFHPLIAIAQTRPENQIKTADCMVQTASDMTFNQVHVKCGKVKQRMYKQKRRKKPKNVNSEIPFDRKGGAIPVLPKARQKLVKSSEFLENLVSDAESVKTQNNVETVEKPIIHEESGALETALAPGNESCFILQANGSLSEITPLPSSIADGMLEPGNMVEEPDYADYALPSLSDRSSTTTITDAKGQFNINDSTRSTLIFNKQDIADQINSDLRAIKLISETDSKIKNRKARWNAEISTIKESEHVNFGVPIKNNLRGNNCRKNRRLCQIGKPISEKWSPFNQGRI